jgi:hypothetical protein
MKKTVFVLNVNNYAPEITELTYPLIKYWANKIGAEFYEIKERKFPDWPVTYEKMQIYELAKELKSEWNIYIDSDALIHPETIDWTVYLNKDTIAHNGADFAGVRWRYDKYFLRDGRNWGSCNWFTIASDWCTDIWKPLDLTLDEALSNIFPTVGELNTVITKEHLIDDYALSRNIAMYGLKTKKLQDIEKEIGLADAYFHYHEYVLPTEEKIVKLKETLDQWRIPDSIRHYGSNNNN